MDFDIICQYKRLIGEPQPLFDVINVPKNLKPSPINPQDIGKQYLSMEKKAEALT